MAQESLDKLVQEAMRGKNDALVSLCENISKGVLFRAMCILRNHTDAEDVAQEILIRVCSGIQDLKDPEVFNIWLNRIVINETNRYLARNSRHGVVLDIDDYREDFPEEDDEFLPQEFVIKEDLRRMVMDVVKQLPERQLQAVLLHYFDGLSVTEAAQAMGVTKPSVSQYLSLARDKVKREFERLGDEGVAYVGGLAALPVGPLLSQVLQQEASLIAPASNALISHSVAASQQFVQGKAAVAVVAKAAPLKLIVGVAAAAVAVSTTILITTPPSDAKAQDTATPAAALDLSTDAAGQVVFSGGDADYPFVNPTQAVAQTSSDFGELTIHNWWISPIDSNTVLFSGDGGVVTEPLTRMQDQKMYGQYMLRFSVEDAMGGTYTLGRKVIIQAEAAS